MRRVADLLLRFQIRLAMTFVYVLVLPLFLVFRPGARLRPPAGGTWHDRPAVEPTLDRYGHPF